MTENENSISRLRIKIFADGADKKNMMALSSNPLVEGFTTNPSLMSKAGISDYRRFGISLTREIPNHPISFEVFADQFDEMERQANEISSWGANVYAKIPISNSRGERSGGLIRRLTKSGVRINVTAMTTLEQVQYVAEYMEDGPPAIVSMFAGRIADTGVDPVPIMAQAARVLDDYPHLELLWASTREVLNIFQADSIGCDIITVTNDILAKLDLVDKDLDQYSLETVQSFHNDAMSSGFTL